MTLWKFFSEIEVHTEVNKGDNIEIELLFDYIPSDLVPLSHFRFIVDLGFMAEQLKLCQSCQSTLHLYNAVGVKPLGFSGLMYVQCPECGGVTKIILGKTHHSGNSKRGCGTFDINTKAATAREYEVGQVLEWHAKESEHKYLLEEVIGCLNINTENEEGKGITVSTDTCWQKKGSGRAYNSVSGMPLIEFNPTRTE
ncbi:unnamed protein product [Mytilus edulis]|uniref:Mutator-like transposase domain-containing protein n=1 Tax=Mytilus edulis TaxID=6550 RepID=A0A8S3QN80_MYTED|nr:unnamed protein product [Mytilus edulis]